MYLPYSIGASGKMGIAMMAAAFEQSTLHGMGKTT
jgi:hypothetical protein